MATVAMVLHPQRPEAVELARLACNWLTTRGHRVVVSKQDVGAAWLGDGFLKDVELLDEDKLAAEADLAISLGGDGTMLRTVEMARGVPVLGVNLGHLGYLSAVEPARLTEALEMFLAGAHHVEERLCLEVSTSSGARFTAFNEAVVEKTVPGHTVRMALSVSGEPFITYAADGLIVATPTGSTAYNMSARGPIMSPLLGAILVTPVSPHMLFDRSLVLMPTDVVKVEILPGRPAVLVVDGSEAAPLAPGDVVECCATPYPARLVNLSDRPSFRSILKAKFHLTDR
jgi:NAD+ kinase